MKKALSLFLIAIAAAATAHEPSKNHELMLDLRTGHNASFGYFCAAALRTGHKFDNGCMLEAGARYNSIGKVSAEISPSYIKEFTWGSLSTEVLLAYTGQKSINSIAAGGGAGVYGKWIGGRLGYYYRMYGNHGTMLQEPFNMYYELCANLLPMTESWDLKLYITNSEMFELERHYQPSFIAECRHYPTSGLGIKLGLGCKPAGMFNISADYYQTFIDLGLCCRW